MLTCPRCATENPAGFRFCGNCAAPLDEPTVERAQRRKVVTVLFCDVAGSTSLGEQRDPEAMRAVMARYFDTVRTVLERHGGTVEKFIGDAVMAVFGHPLLHEDDALRAVRAADELRQELARLNEQLRADWGLTIEVRIGVNTGAVVAGEAGAGETLVTGDAVNIAARLQAGAALGETLIGAETYGLVRDAVMADEVAPRTVKGKASPVRAWRLRSVTAEAMGHARRLDSALVGRDRERRVLGEAFEQAVLDQTCVIFTLLGPAGVGKSRLVHEFLREARDRAQVLRGRCLPYGEGITFWPIAEIVKEAAAITDADTPDEAGSKIAALVAADEHAQVIAGHVAGAIGLATEAGGGDEIFWAVRRLLELLAAERPLIVVLDDVHWAQPTLLDLVDHLADWSRDVPILLLCVARPELLELRPAWAGGKLNATTLMLQALSGEHVAQLVANLLGESSLAATVLERIAQAAEGNPLFVEEFVAMLIDDGLLRLEDGRWVPNGDLDRVTVPPTIRSLLAARIDRLAGAERRVIERASVVGKVFWRGALADLAPEPARAELGPSLLGLVRKELVRPDRSDFAGDDAYRFRHLLIRDAAYEGLPKQERVQLHERFAAWLERTAGERAAEYEEVVGYHLEQAFRFRGELGPVDDLGRALAARARRHLAAAGLRAVERGDMPAAANLLERAGELVPDAAPEGDLQAEIISGLCHALLQLGRFEEVPAHVERLRAAADGPRWRWRATRYEVELRVATDPQNVIRYATEETAAAIRELEIGGDHLGLAEAWNFMAEIRYFLGDVAGAGAAHSSAREHARRVGAVAQEAEASSNIASLGVWDDEPVEEAIATANEVLEWARSAGRRLDEGRVLGILGRLTAMRGDFKEADRLIDMSREILAQLGRRIHLAGSTQWQAMAAHLAGDFVAEERALRAGGEELERLGEKSIRSSTLAELGFALAAQGRFAEAEAAAVEAREIAASDDVEAQVVLRAVLALGTLGRGEADEAARMASEVLAYADESAYFVTRLFLRERIEPLITAVLGADAGADLVGEALAMARSKGVAALEPRLMKRLSELEAQRSGGGLPAGT